MRAALPQFEDAHAGPAHLQLAVTKDAHCAVLEQLEVQNLIAEHRGTRVTELESQAKEKDEKFDKRVLRPAGSSASSSWCHV